ncbi:MAG: flavin reductase family protein [Verrucomicrobiota bacterium]
MPSTAQKSSERERIASALGKVASGLYIATARIGDTPMGMLCSFVEQCSFEPPMISIAIAPGRGIIQALDGHGLFGLHILSKENSALMKSFARLDAETPFAGHALVENLFEIPQFEEAWVYLACKVAGKAKTGDHILYFAEVFDGSLQQAGQEPMVRIRNNGFGY